MTAALDALVAAVDAALRDPSLTTEEGEGWHRVRNPGPGDGVSVHVLCMTPAEHPHDFWDRATDRVVPYPFVEVAPGRWRARLSP